MLGGYKIIGLCTCRVHEEESYRYVKEFNRQFTKKGYRLFVYATCADLYWNSISEKGEAAVYKLIDFDILDALIIQEERIRNKEIVFNLIEQANKHNVPVITIGENMEGSIAIAFDYQAGIEEVVRHVIEEHGITDLHFISGHKGNPFSVAREAAFERVLKEKNLEFRQDMISYGDFWSMPTQMAVEKLIQENRLPEAIICANDTMAMTVCSVLKSHGYSIPEDVVVTGFDGLEETRYCSPQITTCFCNHVDIAKMVADVLEKCFHKEPVEKYYLVVPELMIAETCGCGKHIEIDVAEHMININNRLYGLQEGNRLLIEAASKAQTCESIEQVVQNYDLDIVNSMCCLINQSSMDETINPLTESEETFTRTMYKIIDLGETRNFVPEDFPLEKIVPNIENSLFREMPLIFVALNFLHISLGYVCFRFWDFSFDDYNRINFIVNSLNNAIGGFRNMQYQNFLKKQIEEMYQLDALTGLYNRNRFMREYTRILNETEGKEKRISVMLADLDGLKYINDNFGHGEGDIAIHTVAQALQNACPKRAICARFGGDELIAVCTGMVDPGEIDRKMEEFLSQYNRNAGKPYKVAASLGVYVTESTEDTNFEELLRKTDSLMYMNKTKRKQSLHLNKK